MARPREFDEDEVLERAMDAFWEHGFEKTSLRDLEQATGLGRASLYGAFGDKESLYRRALERFQARDAAISRVLDEAPSVREGIERMFVSWIDQHPKRGCMLSQAASDGGGAPGLKEMLSAAQHETLQVFRGALRKAVERGELSPAADIEQRTRVLFVGLQGISQSTNLGQSRQELLSVARFLVASVFAPDPA